MPSPLRKYSKLERHRESFCIWGPGMARTELPLPYSGRLHCPQVVDGSQEIWSRNLKPRLECQPFFQRWICPFVPIAGSNMVKQHRNHRFNASNVWNLPPFSKRFLLHFLRVLGPFHLSAWQSAWQSTRWLQDIAGTVLGSVLGWLIFFFPGPQLISLPPSEEKMMCMNLAARHAHVHLNPFIYLSVHLIYGFFSGFIDAQFIIYLHCHLAWSVSCMCMCARTGRYPCLVACSCSCPWSTIRLQ